MYTKIISLLILFNTCLFCSVAFAHYKGTLYGYRYCEKPGYYCIEVKKGDSWNALFPDSEEREIVKKLNRMNIQLIHGMKIAVPEKLSHLSVMDIAPFPSQVTGQGHNFVEVNQNILAWGAYDGYGNLVNWGPISAGKNYCSDVGRACKTVSGDFTFFRKQGFGCVSSKYPIETNGGAKMPYCMHFYKGYALHGSYRLPGKNDSHGCVRMFIKDAEWLNKNFIELGKTKVYINPY